MLKENDIKPNTPTKAIKLMWMKKEFSSAMSMSDTSKKIAELWGHNFGHSEVSKALSRAPFLIRRGRKSSYKYIQKISPEDTDDKSYVLIELPVDLEQFLDVKCNVELKDLKINFGKSGNCTAFTLRKILEKLLILTFTKNNAISQIENSEYRGKLVGLDKIVSKAAAFKINGKTIITSTTASKIAGIKFLGDTAAHNAITNVDMETIKLQMPYIITAYKEIQTWW